MNSVASTQVANDSRGRAILAEAERRRIVNDFNATKRPYGDDKLIHQLFEEQAARAPGAVAVIEGDERFTYAELNARANRLARHLVEDGLSIGEYVPVLMSRSWQMVVAQLALLKGGATYVPIDPTLPAERQVFMVRDCRARRVLALQSVTAALAQEEVHWIDCTRAAIGERSEDNLNLPIQARSPAYVMYTSGSTGMPKGVVVPHRGVNRLAINNGYAQIGPADRLAHCSNPAFDASTFEIWVALLNGASVVVIPHAAVLDVERFGKALIEHDVTVLFQTTALFNRLAALSPEIFSKFRYVLFGGEVADPNAVRRVLHEGRPGQLLHVYGPTETTTFATWHVIEAVPADATAIPIGAPISNTEVYILNEGLDPVAIGEVGELFIGGAGLALGYLNRPALTGERFVADRLSGKRGARLYRSGDLGRWLPDGTIEFLGRNDGQVKLRGFRVELGEIEAQLARHPRVAETVVVVREDRPGEKQLVAYVSAHLAPDGEGSLSREGLREHLRTLLPDYMVPTAFVMLDRLPLTPNGKVDRRALPAPQLPAYVTGDFEEPQGEAERALAGIWQTLLGVPRVGRRDNFFELGGHSLLIVQMLQQLRLSGLHAEVGAVYASATLRDLAASLRAKAAHCSEVPPNGIPLACEQITPQMLPLVALSVTEIERIASEVPGGMANIQDIYPLAPLQEGILFHHLLDAQGADTYVVPVLLALATRERLEAFTLALERVVERHDILRTAVHWMGLPQPVQVVYRRAVVPIETIALAPEGDPVAQLRDLMRPERQALDLHRAPLMQVLIAQDSRSDRWFALLKLHHLLCDHVSMDIMLAELGALADGRGEELPRPSPYRDHVAQALAYAREHESEAFFRSKLSGIDESTAPFGLLDVHSNGIRIDKARQALDSGLAARIRSQARRYAVSAATLFHAAWALVVSHSSGREDVVFGTLLLGRLQGSAGAGQTLGMFINTLPLRLRLQGMTAQGFIEHTQRELMDLLKHEQASLSLAQRCSDIGGSAPLFTALLNYRHSVENPETQEHPIGRGIDVIGSQEWTNYPLTVAIDDRGDEFSIDVKTDRRIAPRRIAGYVEAAVRSLVGALEAAPDTPLARLTVVPDSERHELLTTFNATTVPYRTETLIHELFEEQAFRVPSALAVIDERQELTYAELNTRANQVARVLQKLGVGPDRLVALCMDRSVEMLVGLLGILKAGGAYVPLDPQNPTERLKHVLNDADPDVVLTRTALQSVLPPTRAKLICLDGDAKLIEANEGSNLDASSMALSPRHLAYVIYTSGSTGIPKGVMVEHRNIVNYALYASRRFDVESGGGSLICTSQSFDLMLTGLYPTLISGRPMRLCPEERGVPALVRELRQCSQLAPLKLTPSHLGLLEAPLRNRELAGRVRVLVLGGELLQASALVEWRKYAPDTKVFNHYGPTETTVGCIVHEVRTEETGAIPIGKPIANTRVYILSADMQLLPVGATGEIFIAGDGVGRGYFKRPELTAERFLADPFSADPQARMYRTGDLGRWRADGSIEYLGRNDHQVKIRGFRIETGEIEATLLQHSDVKQAIVISREDVPGEKRLVAYIVRRHSHGVTVDVASLRAHLKAALPDYMVPSAFVAIERVPQTANGKLDRRALPPPEIEAYQSQRYEAPVGETEERLVDLWRALLRVERVGRHDNFFDLGGHSLLATRLIARVRELLYVELPLRAVFDAPTVMELAQRVDEAGVATEDPRREAKRSSGASRDVEELGDEEVLAEIAKLQAELGDAARAGASRR